LKAARELGYVVEVIHGWKFEKGDLFSEYVDKFYGKRMAAKTTAEKT
jgi:hypothetical protein